VIDGLFKRHLDRWWDRVAQPLARHLTANQVTIIGLFLVAGACGAFLLHGSQVVFGLCIAAAFATDSLDGAVARLRRETSHFGGYLDALADRYQEVLVFLTLAFAASAWLPAMLALTGAMLTSYAKARVAIEMPIDNTAWPDLMERQERIIFLCALLILGPAIAPLFSLRSDALLVPGLWVLAALCHLTAMQRARRAHRLLAGKDGGGGSGKVGPP
jgi:archaetidylinositol phosphate synthase